MADSSLGDFGAVRDDLISILALGYGGDRTKAASKISELEAHIRAEAKKGAVEATPQIKSAIAPYIYASIGVGVLALLVGIGTILYVRKKHA